MRLPLIAASLGTLALAAAAPPAASAQAPVPVLEWRGCGGGFQCARAAVPLDHARPAAGTIRLALIRKPATDPARRLGSLFMNPGGPGGSTFEFMRGMGVIAAGLNDRFDLVGWDPRGTGRSHPAVDCDVDPEARGPGAQPFPRPFTRAEARLLRDTRAYFARCLARNRRVLPHISTANSVRDLDLLRQAVGDAQLSYLGFSYGTAIGATYASLFPDRHRALVLDAAVDESWWNRPVRAGRDQSAGFEDSLRRFLRACAARRRACSGFGGRSPRAAYGRLLAQLDRTPMRATGYPRRPVDGDDARIATTTALYAKEAWGLLALGLAEAERGDAATLRLLADLYYGRDDGGGGSPDLDQFVAVTGLDAVRLGGPDFYLRAGRGSFRRFDHFWSYGDMVLGLWPFRPVGVFRGPFVNPPTSPPALVVGTTHDPATPYRWARNLTRTLGNARLLTMRGDGHAAYGLNSACVNAAVEGYLEEGTLPPPGATCRQSVRFSAPAARLATADAAARALRRLPPLG
jgi:pimeloyl-ACP methyl ester carboxylesterase